MVEVVNDFGFGGSLLIIVPFLIVGLLCLLFRRRKDMTLISIEGNIGAGKTTLVGLLKEELGDSVSFCPEPVEKWSSCHDEDGRSILRNFYEDKARWGLTFSVYVIQTQLSALRLCINSAMRTGVNVVIAERTVYTGRHVFTRLLRQHGKINQMEQQIYESFFDDSAGPPVNMHLFLRTSLPNCAARMRNRGRKGEGKIDQRYLSDVEQAHEQWLLATHDGEKINKVLSLDGDTGFSFDPEAQQAILAQCVNAVWPYMSYRSRLVLMLRQLARAWAPKGQVSHAAGK
jgi:deoxyguanosine kinase